MLSAARQPSGPRPWAAKRNTLRRCGRCKKGPAAPAARPKLGTFPVSAEIPLSPSVSDLPSPRRDHSDRLAGPLTPFRRRRGIPAQGQHDVLFVPYYSIGSGKRQEEFLLVEGFHPTGGNFLLVQKVTKNTLRGFTPKDPGFLEQGRGGVSFTNGIGRRITYGPWHFP